MCGLKQLIVQQNIFRILNFKISWLYKQFVEQISKHSSIQASRF